MNKMIERAKGGQSVYIHEVKALFDAIGDRVCCVLDCVDGERAFEIGLPEPQGEEQERFVAEYFYARIYNILSMLGGERMTVYADSPHALRLAGTLDDVFGVSVPRSKREGYAKCLNVTDRMNLALGAKPFAFEVKAGEGRAAKAMPKADGVDVLAAFRGAVKRSNKGLFCGIDVGGTDIKLITSRDGHICHIKEYDWFPAAFERISDITDTVDFMVKLSAVLLSLPDDLPEEAQKLKARALDKETDLEEMKSCVAELEGYITRVEPLDGVGLSFPDVVVKDMIVGGETYKTRGVRQHSPDYEREFGELTTLCDRLKKHCTGGVVRVTNDGPMAAYTAAAELSHSELCESVRLGIFAHTLGTELGTGWIDDRGEVPELPLEVYNCIIDLGNFPAREYQPNDVRSLNNFNTGLAGTLQKYASQSGAFRLAEQCYRQEAPELYRELFDKGFLRQEANGIEPATTPIDMRKPFLEHLMNQAERGESLAKRIFEQIGEYMAATWLETEEILHPAAKERVLFGRFVKRAACLECMKRGTQKLLPTLKLSAADDDLAYTPLMRELRDHPDYSVAQFGQAAGAIYFAAQSA